MVKTKVELKALACAAIDRNKQRIIALADSIAAEPELGYKEFKTAAKLQALLDELGFEHEDGVAVTGVIARRKGRSSKLNVSVMGELDAVVTPSPPDADPSTGAVHACGHNVQIAVLAGVAIVLKESGIMNYLDGDVTLMGVPAEEYVEIEYRNELRKKGIIHFLGGKQEFIRLGKLDDVDMVLMQHTSMSEPGYRAGVRSMGSGFTGKIIRYVGKAAHAGSAPFEGVNALNAAAIGLMAVNAQRETFREEDRIRVHPIITRGGDLVNIVPDDVHIETYVRGANIPAILDASEKVNRAFKAGGDAVGAITEITELPGYLPMVFCQPYSQLVYDNLKDLFGEDVKMDCSGFGGGSTDAGDVSHLIPTTHVFFGGAVGGFHTAEFCIVDQELACVTAAKGIVTSLIDLLADGAEAGLAIKHAFKPP